MSHSATALKFPAPDPAETEWGGEDEEELAESGFISAAAAAGESARRQEALRNGLRIGQADGSPTSLSALRSQVATIVAGNHSAGPAWPTGVAELDAALGGGIPRGRVTEVVGSMGAGKTSLVRQVVARVLADGGWVAWVDATRTLAPQELTGLGERLIVVRPRDHTRGAWCTDLLLRSGVFALVVLDGAPVLSRVVGVRLSQLARERDAAFVVLREGTQASRLGGAVRLQVKTATATKAKLVTTTFVRAIGASRTQGELAQQQSSHVQSVPAQPQAQSSHTQSARTQPQAQSLHTQSTRAQPTQPQSPSAPPHNDLQRNYSVLVEKGGSYRTVEVNCAIVMARRVCADTEIPDRRGVARGTRATANDPNQHNGGTHEHDHATVAVAGQQLLQHFTRKGRGRTRAAESSYGRFTRRGEARKLLRTREQQQEQQRESSRPSQSQSRRREVQYQ